MTIGDLLEASRLADRANGRTYVFGRNRGKRIARAVRTLRYLLGIASYRSIHRQLEQGRTHVIGTLRADGTVEWLGTAKL